MPGRTRKFAQLSPQKQRQSPAKYVKLTEHDDDSERRDAAANRIAQGHQRNRSIIDSSFPSPRKAPGAVGTPSRAVSNIHGSGSPAMKMPILANFEEWMKMATDNKINAGNSWNFALIDYFHEMSLLKEGNSINFQKASVTLDGCVKIYTNRVDSVASETGKLLSGLSDRKSANETADGEDAEDDEDEEAVTKKQKRKAKTNAGNMLVKDFSMIQVKKVDMEFFVDPLFKKTSAEFDEGGAKGLLLNHLSVDKQGRIIFDASDASNDNQETTVEEHVDEFTIDLAALASEYFPELADPDDQIFDNLHICPFLRDFKSDSTIIDIPLTSRIAIDEKAASTASYEDQEGAADGMVDGLVDIYDDNENAGFGEVNDVHIPYNNQADTSFRDQPDTHGQGRVVGSENFLQMGGISESMYTQFDALLKKNWTGPSNWKIMRLAVKDQPAPVKRVRKEKEVTIIDFFSEEAEVDIDAIFAPGGTNINLPKSQMNSKSRNLLPEDKHFNSESLLRLFLKPKAKFTRRNKVVHDKEAADEGRFVDMDQKFWAEKNQEATTQDNAGYDANFFDDNVQGDGPDYEDNFEDARQDFATDAPSDFGSQLQDLKTRKTEYVNYAKAAKKVDVRVLKENIWDKLELQALPEASEKEDTKERKFTEIVQSLGSVYPEKAMSEISTSFCFICLLHLANEKGLEITGDAELLDLTVRKDMNVHTIEAV